jgi:geranylgeranyl pyrophosphate synthase
VTNTITEDRYFFDDEMVPKKKLMEQAMEILQEKGHKAVELARQIVLKEPIEYNPLKEAISYFVRDWNDVLHPALVSLACEAVGGKPEVTTEVGAALVLLAGGADLHDDLIDESIVKSSQETVLGKFGKDLTILVGDALLFKGVYMLHEACERLETNKKKAILDLVKRAFFEISGAEAAEAEMRGRIDIPKQDYIEIMRHKVAAGEAAAEIGALLGDGTTSEVETLAEFGRVFGVLFLLRDEFIDVFEQTELSNRVKKEVLPLPIIVTLADESKKSALMPLISGEITEEKIEKIVDIATSSSGSLLLVSEMKRMVNQIKTKIQNLRYCAQDLQIIVTATLEDL